MAEEDLNSNKENSKKEDSFDKLLNKKKKTNKVSDSSVNKVPQTNSNTSKNVNFSFKSTPIVLLLSILTCGFYTYYLVYKWVEIIQAEHEDDSSGLTPPIFALLISIFSCGLGTVYFQYKIPERAAYITRKTDGNSNPARDGIKPPMKDLAIIALFGNIFWWFLALIGLVFTATILNWIILPFQLAFYAWLNLSIERSVEYMACIRDPEK